MTAGPVLKAATGVVARRRVQTLVVFCVLMVATAAGVLGLTLATSATEFSSTFAASHGAHLAVTIDSATVSGARLAATRRLPGVAQAAGPYPQTTITLTSGPASGPPFDRPPGPSAGRTRSTARQPHFVPGTPGQFHPGGRQPASRGAGEPSPAAAEAAGLTVVGRASRFGPLDELTVTQGHWLTGPGQIVLATYAGVQVPVGGVVTVTSAPGKLRLTVVGYASSVAHDEDAWTAPSQIAGLRPRSAAVQVQMLYTFTHAATASQISADLAELRHALPAGAITASVSWLATADSTGAQVTGSAQEINTPFVVAFAVIGLVLAVLITTSVTSAAVAASYRRIGVLKSIGFTPAQVAAACLAQAGIPALAGAVAGTMLGNWWAGPLLHTGDFAGITAAARHIPLWINITVPPGVLALTGLAALAPALRAGRLTAAAAITAGQTPRAGHGFAAHRLASRLTLPRSVSIGLAASFSRPARAAVTLAVVTTGLTAVVLATGLDASLAKINAASGQWDQKVVVGPGFTQQAFTPGQQRTAAAALRAQPGTLRYVAAAATSGLSREPAAQAPGTGSDMPVTAFRGDAGGLGWDITSGSWYHRPGQVVVNTAYPATARLAVGQVIRLTVGGTPVTARVTGEVYAPAPVVGALLTGWQTLRGKTAGLAVNRYLVTLRPGTSRQAYQAALGRALGPGFTVSVVSLGAPGTVALFGQVDTSLMGLLAVLVAVLAGLGVLNATAMLTRERVHDLGVFRAVGMTPRQVIVMVTCWAAAPAIAAAIIALPAGMALQDAVIHAIGRTQPAFVRFATPPASLVHVYTPGGLALLALAGLAIAIASALGPATWAAAARTTTALRAE